MSISYMHCQFLGPRVIPAKAGIQETSAWGLDARLRGHDVLLVPDLRNGHLGGARCGWGVPACLPPSVGLLLPLAEAHSGPYPPGLSPGDVCRRPWHL